MDARTHVAGDTPVGVRDMEGNVGTMEVGAIAAGVVEAWLDHDMGADVVSATHWRWAHDTDGTPVFRRFVSLADGRSGTFVVRLRDDGTPGGGRFDPSPDDTEPNDGIDDLETTVARVLDSFHVPFDHTGLHAHA